MSTETSATTGETRHHRLPFGAEPAAEGGTRFCLFAPAVKQVQLGIEGRDPLAMQADGHGWHQLHVGYAGPGTRDR